MGDPRGYYRILGVPRSATAEQIRQAFREQAKALHPDQADGAGDAEAFRLIREAYETLREPRRRMAYDASGLAHPAGEEDEAWPEESTRGWAGGGEEAADGGESAAGQGGSSPQLAWLARHFLPLTAGVLALALVVALGSLWSAHRQLADREAVLGETYERLARLGEEHADLGARYRSLVFQELERGLGRGRLQGLGTADPAYLHEIPFSQGASVIEAAQERRLAKALIEMAGLIETLPPAADWLIVIEAHASHAANSAGVAVEEWEPALVRLAAVLDHLLGQGLPNERIAIRFDAGFAPPATREDTGDFRAIAQERLLLKLVCCYAAQ